MSNDQTDFDLEEWKKARALLSAFDDRLDSLRKYGFGLVTALITTDAFLLPGTVSFTAGLPDDVKLSILGATLLLLAAVEVLDQNYRALQQAAASRAIVLEQKLNIELTEDIGTRYARTGLGGAYLMYALVGFSLLVLGYFVLGSILYRLVLVVAFVLWLTLSYRYIRPNLSRNGGLDWTIDRLSIPQSASPGQFFSVTATNLWSEETHPASKMVGRVTRRFKVAKKCEPTWNANEVLWRLELQGCLSLAGKRSEGVIWVESAKGVVKILPSENLTWRIPASVFPGPGIYQFRPTVPSSEGRSVLWPIPLPTKLVVESGFNPNQSLLSAGHVPSE